MRTIRYLLFLLAILTILACGGIIGGSPRNGLAVSGVRFRPGIPTTVAPGGTIGLIIDAFPGHSEEDNHYSRIQLTSPLPTEEGKTDWFVTLGREQATVYATVVVPQDTPIGTVLHFEVARSGGVPGIAVEPDFLDVTVSDDAFALSLDHPEVTVTGSELARAKLSVTAVNSPGGTVSISSSVPGVTFEPDTLTFAEGQTTPESVDVIYDPKQLGSGESLQIPIQVSQGSATAGIIFTVHKGGALGTFQLQVSPATVHIHGNQVAEQVQVTITPEGGYRGNVRVALDLPGNGSVVVAPPQTNPIYVAVVSDDPVTVLINLQTQQVGGGTALIGTATVTATSGTTTRTGTFQLSAT